jgi:serine phosphatase RsbU (regulator of sigma subunit)/anti-sigma regulatory factor (Ser/Thr protein kinase)
MTPLGAAALDPLERLQRLQRVSDAALAHLSVDELLEELLLRVRDILEADTAAVLLLDRSRNELVARAAKGIEEEVDRGVRIPMGKGFAGRIAEQRSPVILDRVDHTTVMNPILFQKGIRSLLGVPLIAHGDVLGVMHVGKKSAHRFTQEEVELLQLVADRVALALEVRLSDRARIVIDAFQRTFLPDVLPFIPGLRVATKYLAAASTVGIGGDWYDTFALPSGETVLTIGDVAGHGLPAASLMGKMRNALRAQALMGGGPAEVVARLDDFHRHFGEGELVTLLFGILARDLSVLRFVSAGHSPPLVVRPDGPPVFATNSHASPPLGLAQPPTFAEAEVVLEPGTTVVLYTDGLVERRGESLADGLDRLRSAAARIVPDRDPVDAIASLLDDLLGQGRPADDVALMLVHREARPSERLEFAIEARARSIPLIRRAVLRWLEDHGVPTAVAMEVVTAVSEASANAVEHAYGPAGGSITVAATIADGEVEARVRDTGRWRGSSRGDRGHGLRLIRGLMDDVTLDATDAGTTVTMHRRATG